MPAKTIILKDVEDAKNLVRCAGECNFDVNVLYDSVEIDAKSIMGVLSLDLRHPVTVSYDGENEALEAFLRAHD